MGEVVIPDTAVADAWIVAVHHLTGPWYVGPFDFEEEAIAYVTAMAEQGYRAGWAPLRHAPTDGS